MEIEVVLAAGATIGESPTWAPAEQVLYWIDIKKPALHRFDPQTGGQRSWPMPSDIGAFGLVGEPPEPSSRCEKGSTCSISHPDR